LSSYFSFFIYTAHSKAKALTSLLREEQEDREGREKMGR